MAAVGLSILLCLVIMVAVVLGINNKEVNQYRLMVVRQNMEVINKHNSNPYKTYTMKAYPQFVGSTSEQFAQKNLSPIPIEQPKVVAAAVAKARAQNKVSLSTASNISISFDLRNYINTSVNLMPYSKCINGYAYATTDHIDMLFIRSGQTVPTLSYQHLTDCSSVVSVMGNNANSACYTGRLNNSLQYAMKYGVYALKYYPVNTQTLQYGTNGTCQPIPINSNQGKTYKIKSYKLLSPLNPNERVSALMNKYSVLSAIAVNTKFQSYASGLFNDCDSTTPLNFWVVIDGFGVKTIFGDYWLVKLNWGIGWGEKGHILIDMSKNCGVTYQGFVGQV